LEFKELLDNAVIAANKGVKRVRVNQISLMQQVFEGQSNVDKAFLLLEAFIMRQISRGHIDKEFGQFVISKLRDIERTEDKRRNAREFLGLLKWMFEVGDRLKLMREETNSFNKLIEEFIRRK